MVGALATGAEWQGCRIGMQERMASNVKTLIAHSYHEGASGIPKIPLVQSAEIAKEQFLSQLRPHDSNSFHGVISISSTM